MYSHSPLSHLSPYKSRSHQAINYYNSPSSRKLKWAELSFRNQSCQSESKEILILGLPIAFSLATRILQSFTDISVVGHLGTDYLAASSMANILMAIFNTFMGSFCGTINVLCSQAFGAKRLPQVSEWMQLGCVMVAILSIPSFIAYSYCESILLAFGASKHIASLSGQFTRWSMISILPNSQFMATRNYFKAQSNVLPATYVCAVMVIFNLLVSLMLVYGFGINWIMYKTNGTHWDGLGFIGAPIATAIVRCTQYFIYMFYTFYWKKYHITSGTWSSFKLSTFSCERIRTFMAVGIPQTISSALEDWQIQIIALFASKLNEADLAAFSSSVTIIFLCHTITIGIGDAVSVRVANFLGANNHKYARYVAWVGIILAVGCGIIIGGLLATVGKYLSYIVSGKQEIYELYQQFFPLVGSALCILSVLTIVVGVLIAQARTTGLAISALIGCWCVSVPLSYLLGIYYKVGIMGIWYGITVGYITFALSTFVIFFKSDWKQCALNAVKRTTMNTAQSLNDATNSYKNVDVSDNIQQFHTSLINNDFSLNGKESSGVNSNNNNNEFDDVQELSRMHDFDNSAPI